MKFNNKNIKIPKGKNSDIDRIRDELISRLNENRSESSESNNGFKPAENYSPNSFSGNPQNSMNNQPQHFNNNLINNNNNNNFNPDSNIGSQNVYNQNPQNPYDSGSFAANTSQHSADSDVFYQSTINNNVNNYPNTNIEKRNNGEFSNTFNYSQGNHSTYGSMAGRPSAEDDLVNAAHSVGNVKYKPKSKKSFGKTIIVSLILVSVIFLFSWFLREFVLQSYQISSGSMEKTLMTLDMVFAEKVSTKISKPKPGQIITFDDPLVSGRVLIKRVIATEGQTIDIKNNKLYIDNEEQTEPYVNNLPTTKLSSSKISFPYTVPEKSVWVMGDNRTNSQDSRYFGAIPEDSIIGRGVCVYWPFENFKILN